jgi:hypothetical protein
MKIQYNQHQSDAGGPRPPFHRAESRPAIRAATGGGLSLLPLCAQTRASVACRDQHLPVEGEAPAEQPTLKVKGGRNVWSNLDGALNDAEAMRQVLIRRFGVEPRNMVILTEAAATRKAQGSAITSGCTSGSRR